MPNKTPTANAKMVFQVPASLKQRLENLATKKNINLTAYVRVVLTQHADLAEMDPEQRNRTERILAIARQNGEDIL